MTKFSVSETLRLLCLRGSLVCVVTACLILASTAHAQAQSPLERVEALGLDTMKVGRVTAYFAPADRERAEQLAMLSEEAAAFLERELGIAFDLGLAALAPDHWFSDIPNIPYAIPWPSMPERLIFMPSSLQEGLLIRGQSELEDRRRVDFVLLHEYGHIATKAYFRPTSDRDYLPVNWFEELLATYFGYAFVHSSDSAWVEAAREEWLVEVRDYTPRVLSLDWSFMNSLPGIELSRTYAWYQFILNLRAVEIYEQHGLGFLRALKDKLPWHDSDDWTTASLLPLLEEIAPGFEAWAESLPSVYGE